MTDSALSLGCTPVLDMTVVTYGISTRTRIVPLALLPFMATTCRPASTPQVASMATIATSNCIFITNDPTYRLAIASGTGD